MSARRLHLPRPAGPAVPWLVTVFCALAFVLYLPTISSLAFALVALLACPSERVRARIPAKAALSRVPAWLRRAPLRAVACAALFLVACATAPLSEGLSLNSYLDLQGAQISVADFVEYGRDEVDVSEFLSCTGRHVTVRARDAFIPSQVGENDLDVVMEEGALAREQTVSVLVKDTRAPEITFKKAALSTNIGVAVDVGANVASLADPVDGPLRRVESAPKATGSDVGVEAVYDRGWYRIDDGTDYERPGTYKVEVVACDQHGNESSKSFEVRVVDPLEDVTLRALTDVLEYSNKPIDTVVLVECSDAGTTVAADEVTPDKVGTMTVAYTLSKGGSTRTQDVRFTVRDTRAPAVELASDEVAVTRGGAFDPYANVASAVDEVDGALPRVDAEPSGDGNGWYTVTGAYDVATVGRYPLTVIACDRNGNRTAKEFALVVSEPVPEPAVPADNGRDYVLNRNTMKFHYPSCHDVGKIASHNRWDVHMTRDEVTGMGYSPCGHCKP